jgi:hypothetical protein
MPLLARRRLRRADLVDGLHRDGENRV